MGKMHLWTLPGGTDQEGFKLESMAEGDTNRIAEGKPSIDMASPEGGNASGNIYAAPGSTEHI